MDDALNPSALHIGLISAPADDQRRLSNRNVEEVRSESIGSSATLLARRFARTMKPHPGRTEFDLVDLASGVGAQRWITDRAFDRLNHFEVDHFLAEWSVVGVSGSALSFQGGWVRGLSGHGRLVHDRFGGASEIARPALRDQVRSGCGRRVVRALCGACLGSCAVRAGRVRSGRCLGRSASPDRVSSEVGSGRSCVRVVGGHTPLQVSLRETCGAVPAPKPVCELRAVVRSDCDRSCV